MNKNVSISSIQINGTFPHKQFLGQIDIKVTSARHVELIALNLSLLPPKSVEMGEILIHVQNSKYIHLESMHLTSSFQKNVSINSLDMRYTPAKMTAFTSFNVLHKSLSRHAFTSVLIQELMIPTRTAQHYTNINAIKIPSLSLTCLDIAYGFHHMVREIKVPMTTYWATHFKTSVSGAIVAHRKQTITEIEALYDSATPYYGVGNVVNKFYNNIHIATGGLEFPFRTTITADYSSWFTRTPWVSTHIKATAYKYLKLKNSIEVLGERKHKVPTDILARQGMYREFIPLDCSNAFADYGSGKIWLTDTCMLGYTDFNSAVNYGFYIKLASNINMYNIESAWLGLPILSNNSLPLGVTISLMAVNDDINFRDYTTTLELENSIGTLASSSDTLYPNVQNNYVDITSVIKEFQSKYQSGYMVLKVEPSLSMYHDDSLLRRPFLFRIYNINLNSRFIYKIFNTPKEMI